jgi:hypothetical protein
MTVAVRRLYNVCLKIYDFAPLFQVALGLNIAVPFFSDTINRVLVSTEKSINNLIGWCAPRLTGQAAWLR